MTIGWQEIATGLVVLSAAAWLVRKARRAHRERVVCANCPVPKIPARPAYWRTEKRSERPSPLHADQRQVERRPEAPPTL